MYLNYKGEWTIWQIIFKGRTLNHGPTDSYLCIYCYSSNSYWLHCHPICVINRGCNTLSYRINRKYIMIRIPVAILIIMSSKSVCGSGTVANVMQQWKCCLCLHSLFQPTQHTFTCIMKCFTVSDSHFNPIKSKAMLHHCETGYWITDWLTPGPRSVGPVISKLSHMNLTQLLRQS